MLIESHLISYIWADCLIIERYFKFHAQKTSSEQ